MRPGPRSAHTARLLLALVLLLAVGAPGVAGAAGARLYKSGPVQISADGATVWVANADNDSVSRFDTASEAVLEVPLAAGCSPRGLTVTDDGDEVWVACLGLDRLVVLAGADGSLRGTVDLPWGTGPWSVALAPPASPGGAQTQALVTGYRSARLLVVDVPGRTVSATLGPVYRSPWGIAFTADGAAWVTHLFADGEHTRLSRVELGGPSGPRVTTTQRVTPSQPQNSAATAPRPAEGGYLTPRGHPAQVPDGADGGRLWLPVQYQNLHDTQPSPDSAIQSTLRKVDPATRQIAGGGNTAANPDHPAKVILSAVAVHDPTSPGNNPTYDGPGWDAGVSGPVDLAFSADGATAWVLHEASEDLVVVPTSTPPVRPAAAPSLVEIPVGRRPVGVVASPASGLGYVANALSRDLSVVDLSAGVELRRVALTPVTGEPLTPQVHRGAEIFHTSNEDAVSNNRKVSCASCHLNGEHDGRSWDFQHLPGSHGPRSTPSLLLTGTAHGPVDPATGWGQLHRSGDRDEVQDFEHTFRGVQMGGDGFLAAPPNPELGTPNAGLDTDLDALAAYVLSLGPPPHSPFRDAAGALTPAAVRGATFFMGAGGGHPGNAGCATCHPPAAGFTDRAFHDVGQAVRPGEQELQNRSPANRVNTPTLIGLWTTPPYDGIVGWAGTLTGALLDFRDRPGARAPHGSVGGLTGRQLRDLAELLLSLDGSTTAAEVSGAVDDRPPSVVRVSPTSPTRLEVWLDESVEVSSAETPAAWTLTDLASGQPVPVVAAVLDPVNADRVTLTTAPLGGGCAANPRQYSLAVAGPLFDLADSVSGGTANALVAGPPVPFDIGGELTVTLGASGYENLTVEVHDAATIPGLTTWSHGSAWLAPYNGGNTGFLRFDWSGPFTAATGVTDPEEILAAEIELDPDFGDAQPVEARRVLLAWYDHHGGDFNNNPIDPATGNRGPTWRDVRHNFQAWNSPNAGASTPGVDGDDPADYHGPWDTAHTPDATLAMPAIDRPAVLAGPTVTDAFRFWLANPGLDHGYALRLTEGATLDARFTGAEQELGDHAPVLRLTYRTPGCGVIFADGFESGDTAAWSAAVP